MLEHPLLAPTTAQHAQGCPGKAGEGRNLDGPHSLISPPFGRKVPDWIPAFAGMTKRVIGTGALHFAKGGAGKKETQAFAVPSPTLWERGPRQGWVWGRGEGG
jgi:hypothetical protein